MGAASRGIGLDRWSGVEADLVAHWSERLVPAGYSPQVPSLWLLEGILFYLNADQLQRIDTYVYRVKSTEIHLDTQILAAGPVERRLPNRSARIFYDKLYSGYPSLCHGAQRSSPPRDHYTDTMSAGEVISQRDDTRCQHQQRTRSSYAQLVMSPTALAPAEALTQPKVILDRP
jgi:hypothetical protein